MRQQNLLKVDWKHRYCSGGVLRQKRAGRSARPLSTKEPLHVVFKSNHRSLLRPKTFRLSQDLIRKYARKFHIKVEQTAIQHDHIHLLVRAGKRSRFLTFFRVLSGQISQTVTDTFDKRWEGPKFWKHRPFSRVIKGRRAYKIVRDYIQLNLKEATREISYRKQRLKGLTPEELQSLWD